MQVAILSEKIARVRSEILIVGYFQDLRPIRGYAAEIDWFTNGAISSLILQDKISGPLGEATLIATSKILTPKILLIGLGRKANYTYKILQELSTHVMEILARLKVRESVAELWGQEECAMDLSTCLEVFLQGCTENLAQARTLEAPTLLTLLTHRAERVKELAQRIREFERQGALPNTPTILPRGSEGLRVESKR